MTHNHEWSRDVTVRLNFPGQAAAPVSPTLMSHDRGGAAAISLILAASQSSPGRPGEGLGMEMETPPPSSQHRSEVCNAMSPHNLTPTMSLPPIDSVEGDFLFCCPILAVRAPCVRATRVE
jgi:hypothetical protein